MTACRKSWTRYWRSRTMFGFGKKQKSVELPRFRFATLPDPVAPTIATADILQKQKIIVGLWTLLISLTLVALIFGFLVEGVAKTEPYVADGGVFGCPVPILKVGAK